MLGSKPRGSSAAPSGVSAHEIADVVWDTTLERPTLGGALTLRQEAELLARQRRARQIRLHQIVEADLAAVTSALTDTVFRTSAYPIVIDTGAPPPEAWPLGRSVAGFSYFSFERLIDWYRSTGERPRLTWSEACRSRAGDARNAVSGVLVCAHLKRVSPFDVEESNADLSEWQAFLAAAARPGERTFVLVGDDPLPDSIDDIPGVFVAKRLGLDLATQLCLVGLCDGYLGMASGIGMAANFSDVPYVLFKHPRHHVAEMKRELGEGDHLPFATDRQLIWRRLADERCLWDALRIVSR